MCRELFRRSVLLTSVIFKVSFFISCRVPTCFDFSKAEIVDRLTAPYRSTRLRLILFSKEDNYVHCSSSRDFGGIQNLIRPFQIAKKCLIVCDFPHPTWCCYGWTVR